MKHGDLIYSKSLNTYAFFVKDLQGTSLEVPEIKTYLVRDDSGIYILERVIDDKTILLSIKEHPTISRFLYNGTVRLFSVRKDLFRLVNSGNFRRIKYE